MIQHVDVDKDILYIISLIEKEVYGILFRNISANTD